MPGRLDPQVQELLDVMAAAGREPLHTLSVEEARDRMRAAHSSPPVPLALADVRDVRVPSPGGPLGMRLYRPREGVLPVALFLHGGGWTLNDLDTHDDLCRRLAKRSGWLFASLDYRRAPEHPHPAAVEDAYVAYRWLLDNAESLGCDAGARAVVGESSGATTAAALSLFVRDSGAPPPTFQVLAYPILDRLDRWPSYAEHGTGYSLDRAQIEWFFGHYVADGASMDDPYLVPMAAPDLAGLPPTLILTAEFDPLRDEGIEFARRLERDGVEVQHVHAADQMHGYLLLGRIVRRAAELVDGVGDALAARVAGPFPIT